MDAVDDRWYKDAVIYELSVRTFADENGDGIGDFRGLTGRLDYLEGLGATAICLADPFCNRECAAPAASVELDGYGFRWLHDPEVF